jgi:zona occludens toxin (predicted ATPase)
MRPMAIFGAVLLVFGIVALIYQGVSYTSHDTVIDIGPIHATADRQRTLPLPPIVGLAAVAGGVVLLITGGKARA